MKNNKRIKIIVIIISSILLVFLGVFVFGKIWAIPTKKSLDKQNEVVQYNLLEEQFKIEQEILKDYEAVDYTLQKPYIIIDPYGMNPLSALVIFEASKPCNIQITVTGDDIYSAYTYTKENIKNHAEIPIIGLYPGRENKIQVMSAYEDGTNETMEWHIATEPLPSDFQTYTLKTSKPEKMEAGITLMTACFEHSYSALVDCNGQVRGYLSDTRMAHGTSMILLENGNMLSTGNEYKQIPYNMTSLIEYNWLGKVFKEYEIPNAVHHSIKELPNGDILAVSNNPDMFQTGTREDVAIVIDRQSGNVVKEYNFREIIDETREPFHHFHPPILNAPNIDWMHMNAAINDEANNAFIVSSPTQSMVISIDKDTSNINWILGPHEGYEGSSKYLAQYLLTPVGDNFEWQWCQHDPMILPDFDNNLDTIDILLMDNGQSKSFTKEGSVLPENNYSRGVHFRIDQKNKTVSQIWQYGKERGFESYATFLGDADYMSVTGNRLLVFGGQLRNNGTPVDDIVSGVVGQTVTHSQIIEVTEDGEVVFEVSVSEGKNDNSAETYQAERMDFYQEKSFDYSLGEIHGESLGKSYLNNQTNEVKPPAFYIGKLSVIFNDIHREENRLIIDGTQLYKNKAYMIGKAYIILRGKNGETYTYGANSGLNGRFFASIDLSELSKDEYSIAILGGIVIEGNDALSGKRAKGQCRTEWKVLVE